MACRLFDMLLRVAFVEMVSETFYFSYNNQL